MSDDAENRVVQSMDMVAPLFVPNTWSRKVLIQALRGGI
jgi:hypothetical protein